MNDELQSHPSITLNEDGTFCIEEFGCHYGSASMGQAIAWFVERLLEMREQAAK